MQVGNAHAQSMKAYANQEGEKVLVEDDSCNAQTTLVFSSCVDCEYTLKAYAAKIFVQNCENITLHIAPESKVLTETIEVHRCVSTSLDIMSRIGTLQIDQSVDCSAMFDTSNNFGNPSMIRKGREFGKDGRVVWAGCENLVVKIGDREVVCDFENEKEKDLTVDMERSQFKVSLDAKGYLRSEKVVRLDNGFPTTKREEEEHKRREEAALQGLAQRMGITINRKEESVGKKCKPNDPCTCGSGKKYKKCCGSC